MVSALKSLQSCWVCSIWRREGKKWSLTAVLHITGWGIREIGERAGVELEGSGFAGEKDTARNKETSEKCLRQTLQKKPYKLQIRSAVPSFLHCN